MKYTALLFLGLLTFLFNSHSIMAEVPAMACPTTFSIADFNQFCGSAEENALDLPDIDELIEFIQSGAASALDANFDAIPDVSWFRVENDTTVFTPGLGAFYEHPGIAESCDRRRISLAAYLQCDSDFDGLADDYNENGVIGDFGDFILLYSMNLSIYPDLSQTEYTINADNSCGPYIVSGTWDCSGFEGYEVVHSLNGSPSISGGEPDYQEAVLNFQSSGNVVFSLLNNNVPTFIQEDCGTFSTPTILYECENCPKDNIDYPDEPSAIVCSPYEMPTAVSRDSVQALIESLELDVFNSAYDSDNDGFADIFWRYGQPDGDFFPFSADIPPRIENFGCDPELYFFDCYILCDLDDDSIPEDFDGDGTIDHYNGSDVDDRIYLFFYDVIIFPELPEATVTACGTSINNSCDGYSIEYIVRDGENNIIENGLDTSYNTTQGNPVSVAFEILDTETYSESTYPGYQFTRADATACQPAIQYPLSCPNIDCPFLLEPGGFDVAICGNETIILTEIEVQNNPDNNPIRWFLDPYNSEGPQNEWTEDDLIHSGSSCFPEEVSIYAMIGCGDNFIPLLYTITATLSPDFNNFLSVVDNGSCSPFLFIGECFNNTELLITNDFDDNGMAPDFSLSDDSGTIVLSVVDENECELDDDIYAFYNCSCVSSLTVSPEIVAPDFLCEEEPLGTITAIATEGGTLKWFEDQGLDELLVEGNELQLEYHPDEGEPLLFWVVEYIDECPGPIAFVSIPLGDSEDCSTSIVEIGKDTYDFQDLTVGEIPGLLKMNWVVYDVLGRKLVNASNVKFLSIDLLKEREIYIHEVELFFTNRENQRISFKNVMTK